MADAKKRKISTEPLQTLGGGPRELDDFSYLQLERLQYKANAPAILTETPQSVLGDRTTSVNHADAHVLKKTFPRTFESPIVSFATSDAVPSVPVKPLRVGVVFCGRQTPGAHNVVWGVYDALKQIHPGSETIGFLDGTKGLFEGKHIVITEEVLGLYRNQGGFDMLSRTVDQIRGEEQCAATADVCTALRLNGLVMVGGTYTNTDAAFLAEYMLDNQRGDVRTCVIGVPASIDGDLKNSFIQTTIGFDTACKLYSQLIGNMATDGASAAKYYYFVRVMGRTASHIALECALQTNPNVVLIGEALSAHKHSLHDVIVHLADVVMERAKLGKNYGLVLIPEGLIMHITELVSLVDEMNTLLSSGTPPEGVRDALLPWNRAVLDYLPPLIRDQLFSERESHGTLQLSQISTESLLADLVSAELDKRKKAGLYKGGFAPITHFFGYQARCGLPSNFDCDYGYCAGRVSALLTMNGHTGYAAAVTRLHLPVAEWEPLGVPLTAMMTVTGSGPSQRPIIPSTPLDIHSHSFHLYKSKASAWQIEDDYDNPGPMQFRGPTADAKPLTVVTDRVDYVHNLSELSKRLSAISHFCRPGVSDDVLETALVTLKSLHHTLELLRRKQ